MKRLLKSLPSMKRIAIVVMLAMTMVSANSIAGAPKASAATSHTVYYCILTRPTLREGTTNHGCTAALQMFLRVWRQDPYLPINGRYTALTRELVWYFQQAAGLKRDGIVGPLTWNAIHWTCNSHPIWTAACGVTTTY